MSSISRDIDIRKRNGQLKKILFGFAFLNSISVYPRLGCPGTTYRLAPKARILPASASRVLGFKVSITPLIPPFGRQEAGGSQGAQS